MSKESNAKEINFEGEAFKMMQAAHAKIAAFKKLHGVTDYRLAKQIGIAQSSLKAQMTSQVTATIDRITAGLVEITKVQFDPFSPIPPTRNIED